MPAMVPPGFFCRFVSGRLNAIAGHSRFVKTGTIHASKQKQPGLLSKPSRYLPTANRGHRGCHDMQEPEPAWKRFPFQTSFEVLECRSRIAEGLIQTIL